MEVERLMARQEDTMRELASIWDEIGLSQTVREEHYFSVFRQIEDVYMSRLRQERNVRDQYKRNLEASARAIQQIANVVDLPSEELDSMLEVTKKSNFPLMEAYSILAQYLDKLTQLKEERFDMVKNIFLELFKIEGEMERSLGSLELLNDQCDPGNGFQFPFTVDDVSELQSSQFKDLSQNVVERLNIALVGAQNERLQAEMVIREHEQQIACLCSELGEEIENHSASVDPLVPPLSERAVVALKDIITQLNNLRVRREFIIHEYANQIKCLWDLLDVPEEYRKEFVDLNVGRSMTVIKACELELSQLNAHKHDRIAEMAKELKSRIIVCWDQLGIPDFERRLFETRFEHASPNESMLENLKTMVTQLENKVKQAVPIITQIRRRTHLLQERTQLDIMSADPKRLLSKKASCNLKKEEQLRKHVSMLPAETASLIQALEQWIVENSGERFSYEGKDYLAELQAEIAREKQDMLKEKMHRKARLGLVSNVNTLSSLDVMTPHKTPLKQIPPRASCRIPATKPPVPTSKVTNLVSKYATPLRTTKGRKLNMENDENIKLAAPTKS